MIFERHDQLGRAPKKLGDPRIQRFDKPRIDDRHFVTFRRQLRGHLPSERHHVAEREKRHFAPAPVRKALDNFGFANLKKELSVLDLLNFSPIRKLLNIFLYV